MVTVCHDRLQAQLDSINALDSKASVFLGIGAALIAILGAALPLVDRPLGVASGAALAVSVATFAALSVACFRATRLREWGYGADPDYMLSRYGEVDDKELTWEAAEGYAKAYLGNEPDFIDKAQRVRAAAGLLVALTVALFICFAAFALRL